MKMHWVLLISLMTLALASCGGAAPAVTDSSEQPEPTSNLIEEPLQLEDTPEPSEMSSTPPSADKFVALSKKDLADRLNIEADKIMLIEAKEILWPDAALGCPRPGMVYAQGQVPGYQILLEAQGKRYTYNTDLNGQFILCQEPASRNGDSLPPASPTSQIGVPID